MSEQYPPNDETEQQRIVNALREDMLDKLHENSDKPHWHSLTIDQACSMLADEVKELTEALQDPEYDKYAWEWAVRAECADVANFCAIISDLMRKMCLELEGDYETPNSADGRSVY